MRNEIGDEYCYVPRRSIFSEIQSVRLFLDDWSEGRVGNGNSFQGIISRRFKVDWEIIFKNRKMYIKKVLYEMFVIKSYEQNKIYNANKNTRFTIILIQVLETRIT